MWARKKADWYDPEIEEEDEILKGVDKDEIDKQKINLPLYNSYQY